MRSSRGVDRAAQTEETAAMNCHFEYLSILFLAVALTWIFFPSASAFRFRSKRRKRNHRTTSSSSPIL
jgi:hypothetical protein